MKLLNNIKTFFTTIKYSNYREIDTDTNYLAYTQGYVDVETSMFYFFNRTKATFRILNLSRQWRFFDTGEPLPYQSDISILKESYSDSRFFDSVKQRIIEGEQLITNDN
jgi:hypothetical protein